MIDERPFRAAAAWTMEMRTMGVWLAMLSLGAVARAQPNSGPARVVAARVEQQQVTAAQTFVGSVMPVQRATIGSAVAGRVVECPFEEGDRVEAGQKLAQLLTSTISLELAAAEGELENRRQQLAEYKNGSRPEELEQARARMAAAGIEFKFRDARHERLKVLRESDGVSEDEYADAQALAQTAEQRLAEAKAAYDLAIAGPRKEAIARAGALVQIQEAIVERLRDQISKHTIASRFAGYVVKQHTEVGQWLQQGDPVAEVVAIDEVDVVVQVVEQSAPYVQPGTTARIEVPAIPDRILEGTVLTTVPQADVLARTFPVKVRVKNELTTSGPLLMPGMYARVVLPVGSPQLATLVPKDAIVLGQQSPSVFSINGGSKVGDEGVATPVPVSLGVSQGSLIQVFGSIAPGQLVVVEGNERLRPGQAVSIVRIAAPQEDATKPPPQTDLSDNSSR